MERPRCLKQIHETKLLKCTSYLASYASPPSSSVMCSLKGYLSVCVLPQQAAVCRRRSASCWWPARLWSWPHSQQRAGWPGTNQSLRPPRCPLGSCGPRAATCGCHIHRRVDPDPAYGWNWEDTWHTNQWWYNMSTWRQMCWDRQVDCVSVRSLSNHWSVTELVKSCRLQFWNNSKLPLKLREWKNDHMKGRKRLW